MIRKYAIACLMMFVVSASGITLANDIYKWTDEDGNVHYGDRPSGDSSEERLAISSKPTDTAMVQARVESRYERDVATKEEVAAAAGQGAPYTRGCPKWSRTPMRRSGHTCNTSWSVPDQ